MSKAQRTPRPTDVRRHQRRLWTRTASGRTQVQQSGAVLSSVTDRIIRDACVKPGMRVLDVACGAGNPSLDLAQIVGSRGMVVGIDITPAMIELARCEASEAGIQNVRFEVVENETVPYSIEQDFDVVSCRFGLMFMPDPLAALIAWRKVLKAGGRVSICTHATLPAFYVTMMIVERLAPAVAKELRWRDVLSLSSPSTILALCADAGFIDIRVNSETQPHIGGNSVSEGWSSMIRRSPLYSELLALPPVLSDSIRDACIDELSSQASHKSIAQIFGGSVLYANARKPYL